MLKKMLMAGAAAAIGFSAVSAQAAGKLTWDYSWWGNPRAVTKGTEAVAKYLDEQTGGAWTLKIHYGGAISPPKENIDNIKRGAIHAGTVCTGYHPGKNPINGAGDLPFMPFGTWDKMIAAYEALRTHPESQKEWKKWGGQAWYVNLLPNYEFFGSGEPPKTIADFNGKTVRGLGGIGEAMKKLGASLKSAPAPEAYELLERGVVWGWSFPYSYTFGAYRLHEISTWYTSNLQLGSNHCPTITSIKAYKKLPDEWQRHYQNSRKVAYAALIQAYEDADKKWIPIYQSMKNLKEVRFSDAELAEAKAKGGKPVWDEWVKAQGPAGKAVFDAMVAAAASK